MLKRIGTDARLAIEEMMGGKVYLKLWVKVIEGWADNPSQSRRLLSDEGTS